MIHKFIIELTDDCKGYNEEVERLEREYGIEPVEEHDSKVRADAIDEVLKLPRNTYKTYEHGFIENEEAIFVSDILDLKEQKCLI